MFTSNLVNHSNTVNTSNLIVNNQYTNNFNQNWSEMDLKRRLALLECDGWRRK